MTREELVKQELIKELIEFVSKRFPEQEKPTYEKMQEDEDLVKAFGGIADFILEDRKRIV
jgi:hypothetical protein